MITAILTEAQEALRSEAQEVLRELADVLRHREAGAAERLDAAARGLEDLFYVILTGAPGSAVGPLADALLADPPPRHLRLATTSGGEPGRTAREDGRRADLALYLTLAHRPLAPAERPLLEAAARSAERLLVVVDEAEMLRLAEDLERMEEAVAVAAERLLSARPWVRMIATAEIAGRPAARESLVPSLAGTIVSLLRAPAVLRPKLAAPLDAGLAAARRALAEVAAGWAALDPDRANLEAVEREVSSFEETAGRALRRAQDALARAVAEHGERTGALVHRASRPFTPPWGLRGRFERHAEAELPERMRGIATELEAAIATAAGTTRQALVARLATAPTERSQEAAGGRPPAAGRQSPAPPGTGPVVREIEGSAHPREHLAGDRPLASALGRSSWLSLVLLVAGIAFAVVPALVAAAGGAGLTAVILGGGLGGAAILAGLAVQKTSRRRLRGDLSARVEALGSGAAAALAAGAASAIAEARVFLLAPVARYAEAVAAEREQLATARTALEGLIARLEDLRRRAAAA